MPTGPLDKGGKGWALAHRNLTYAVAMFNPNHNMSGLFRASPHLLIALWTGLVLLALTAALPACSGTESVPATDLSPTVPAATPTPRPVQEFQALSLSVAVTDLAVGPGNRLAFALIGTEGPVRVPSAAVKLTPPGDAGGQGFQGAAVFRPWPVEPGGIYSTVVNFPQAGLWVMEVRVFLPGGGTGVARTQLSVATASSSPALGTRPPASRNRTSAKFEDPSDPAELATITSAPEPDPDLYRLTVAEALESGIPTVVSFATPAFCRTATCGPQVQVLTTLRQRHGDTANFIHIEVYEDPHRLMDLSFARLVTQMEEWGLLSEPFTFVLGRDGRVAAKFEGFVNEDKLGAALAAALDS